MIELLLGDREIEAAAERVEQVIAEVLDIWIAEVIGEDPLGVRGTPACFRRQGDTVQQPPGDGPVQGQRR